MTIPQEYQKAGYRTIYGDEEAKQAIANAEIQGSGGGGSGGGGGDASAANQQTEINKLTSLDNKATNDPATASNQSTEITRLTSINNKVPVLGSNTAINSIPVTLATDDTGVGADITGTTIPAGGSGIRGLLSWIAKLISDRLPFLSLSGDKLKVDLTNTLATPIYIAPSNASPTSVQGTVTANLGTIASVSTEATLSTVNTKIPASINSRIPTTNIADNLTVTGSASTLNGDAVASTDISNYSSLILQITGSWVGGLYVQFSNDNSYWQSGSFSQIGLGTTTPNPITGNGIYCFSRQGKYCRVRFISYTSGTASGNLFASNDPGEHIKTIAPISVAVATQTFYDSFNTKLPTATTGDRLKVDGSGVTQPISAASLPLPTLAATSTLQTSILNRLMPAGNSSTLYISMGTAVSGNLKASSGNVYALYCVNVSTGLKFLQLFDSVSAPTVGAVPKVPPYPIPANNGLLVIGQDVLGGEGINFTAGISFGISTTALTYTAATATDAALSIRYA